MLCPLFPIEKILYNARVPPVNVNGRSSDRSPTTYNQVQYIRGQKYFALQDSFQIPTLYERD